MVRGNLILLQRGQQFRYDRNLTTIAEKPHYSTTVRLEGGSTPSSCSADVAVIFYCCTDRVRHLSGLERGQSQYKPLLYANENLDRSCRTIHLWIGSW